MLHLLRTFTRDRRGMATLELALAMGVLVPLLVAVTEFQRYLRHARQLTSAAESFATLLSHRAQPLADFDWTQDSEIISAVVSDLSPRYGADWREKIGLQATYVRFLPDNDDCVAGSTCTYSKADIRWVWSGATSGSQQLLQAQSLLRTCSVLRAGDGVGAEILPAPVFGDGTLLVIDLVYGYQPALFTNFFQPRIFVTQAFAAPLHGPLEIDPAGLANEVAPCS